MSTLRDLEGNVLPTPGGPITASDVTVPPGLPGDPTNVLEALEGLEAGGAVPTLAQVLAEGADAGGVAIENFKAEAITDQFDATGNAGEVATADGAGTWGWQALPSGTPTLIDVLTAGASTGNTAINGANTTGGGVQSLQSQDGLDVGYGSNWSLQGGTGAAGASGGQLELRGGAGDGGSNAPSGLVLPGGTATDPGVPQLRSAAVFGDAGQFLASDGASGVVHTTPLIRHAAGVPTGAPQRRGAPHRVRQHRRHGRPLLLVRGSVGQSEHDPMTPTTPSARSAPIS